MAKPKIITISRQYASGGRIIGQKVAEKLGIPCYDSQILDEIAKESGFAVEYVKEQGEYVDNGGFFGNLGGLDYYGHSNRITIWVDQCRVLRQMASKGPCVIVGRCADYVLRDEADLLRVFIYADMDERASRSIQVYGEPEEGTFKRLKSRDKRRAAYYDIYTDQKFGDPMNYEICLNSSAVGVDRAVEIIADLYSNPTEKTRLKDAPETVG